MKKQACEIEIGDKIKGFGVVRRIKPAMSSGLWFYNARMSGNGEKRHHEVTDLVEIEAEPDFRL